MVLHARPHDIDAIADGDPLIVLLDVDGTIAPIAPRPEDARVPDATRDVLRRLVALPNVEVAFVSGRGASDGAAIVDLAGTWFVGNHGTEWRDASGQSAVHPDAAPFAERLRAARDRARAALVDIPGAFVEDKTWGVALHYRLVDRSRVHEVTAAADAIGTELGLARRPSKEVVELRPPVSLDKGTAVVDLLERLGASTSDARVLFAGDDVTDEDAFVALNEKRPDAMTIRVGAFDSTAARFTVEDPAALAELLERLADRRS